MPPEGQNDTLGHRDRKGDPLYRARRPLTKADERLDDRGRDKLLACSMPVIPGRAPGGWHAKEVIRLIYEHQDPRLAVAFVDRLGRDLQDPDRPPEVRSLGRTLLRWGDEIAVWHQAQRIERVILRDHQLRNCRIRALLDAGNPNWHLNHSHR